MKSKLLKVRVSVGVFAQAWNGGQKSCQSQVLQPSRQVALAVLKNIAIERILTHHLRALRQGLRVSVHMSHRAFGSVFSAFHRAFNWGISVDCLIDILPTGTFWKFTCFFWVEFCKYGTIYIPFAPCLQASSTSFWTLIGHFFGFGSFESLSNTWTRISALTSAL